MQTRPRPVRYRAKNRKRKPVREGRPNLELQPHQVVIRPLVTEKGTHHSTRHNAYSFEVHSAATKGQIKTAIESLFPVRVVGVRTQIRPGKVRRFKGREGHLPDWKKAVVELHNEDRIEFF
ncbi:MAG: 50S ribosomal protein L23 [Gemmataceae bacterium]